MAEDDPRTNMWEVKLCLQVRGVMCLRSTADALDRSVALVGNCGVLFAHCESAVRSWTRAFPALPCPHTTDTTTQTAHSLHRLPQGIAAFPKHEHAARSKARAAIRSERRKMLDNATSTGLLLQRRRGNRPDGS